MKVLQLGMNWFPERSGGGLDRFFWELMPHLAGAGVTVRGYVAASLRAERESSGLVRGFAPWRSSLARRLFAVRTAVAHSRCDFGPDLVASHFALYAWPAIDRVSDIPLVVHFHGPWAHESRTEGQAVFATVLKAFIERSVYRRSRRLIVLSHAFGRILQERYGVREDLIRVVPGGVAVERFDPGVTRAEARARLGWPQDRAIVLSVRRLVNRMGIEDLIDAVAQLRRQIPDVFLMVAGRGALETALQQRIREQDLDNHVRLIGFVPERDLPLAYRAADLSVVPSTELEGFGLITIESLAAGTPVLVTPVGGLPEAVQALSPHLVLPGTGTTLLADGIATALSGRVTLPADKACQAFARQHFDWPIIARRVRAVYDEALN